MSDGVPTRQGRVARQIKVFFENPKKETQEFCHCDFNDLVKPFLGILD